MKNGHRPTPVPHTNLRIFEQGGNIHLTLTTHPLPAVGDDIPRHAALAQELVRLAEHGLPAPSLVVALATVRAALMAMNYEQRLAMFRDVAADYCTKCGSSTLPCGCAGLIEPSFVMP